MIIRTKETAKVFYNVEYYVNENKLPEEIIKELKRVEKIYGSHSAEYIKIVDKIVTMYSYDENAEQHNDPFGFEIDSVEEIEWEEK